MIFLNLELRLLLIQSCSLKQLLIFLGLEKNILRLAHVYFAYFLYFLICSFLVHSKIPGRGQIFKYLKIYLSIIRKIIISSSQILCNYFSITYVDLDCRRVGRQLLKEVLTSNPSDVTEF